MTNVSMLARHRLKQDKRHFLSFGVMLLLSAFLLNTALVLLFQVDKAYTERAAALNTAGVNLCLPQAQDRVTVADLLCEADGVTACERREAQMVSAVIRDFRGTDFDIPIFFYNKDSRRNSNRFTVIGQSDKTPEQPIYIPLYLAQFGQFQLGDCIMLFLDGQEYSFTVAGILEEMQYGNAGNGAFGLYLPDAGYRALADRLAKTVVEYSLLTEPGLPTQTVKREAAARLSEQGISLLYTLDSDSARQTRTAVSRLLTVILTVFSLTVALVGLLLSRLRIRNVIEEEMTALGVQKAIGYTGGALIGSVLLAFGTVGAASFLLGIPLSYGALPVLTRLLAQQSGFSFSLSFDGFAFALTGLLLVGLTLAFAYFSAQKMQKLRPIDAIRGNRTGRLARKNAFPLEQAGGGIPLRLLFKQMAAGAGQNVLLLVISVLLTGLLLYAGTLFYNAVICPQNLTATLSEETPDLTLQIQPGKRQTVKDTLAGNPAIRQMLAYDTDSVKLGDETAHALICEDFSAGTNDLCYEGRNPTAETEIAVGARWRETYALGDTVRVETGGREGTFTVVGFLQSVNFQGEVCGLTQEGYRRLGKTGATESLYLYGNKNADIEKLQAEIEAKCSDTVLKSSNSRKLAETSQRLYAGIVAAVVAAVLALTVLTEFLILYSMLRSAMVQRRRELGIYKAIGYSNRQLTVLLTGGFLPAFFAGTLVSALGAVRVLPAVNRQMFRLVGAMKNSFVMPFPFLLLLAVLQMAVILGLSVLLARPIRKISPCSLLRA